MDREDCAGASPVKLQKIKPGLEKARPRKAKLRAQYLLSEIPV